MNDLDPAQVASLEDLAECLRQLHLRADRPSLRELEDRTKHATGLLPGTHLKRVRLGRTTLNDVLRGLKFPKKAFLLTFVEALNVDLDADRRWEQAWDRLAVEYQDQAAEAEVKQLRRQLDDLRKHLAAAEHRAESAQAQADKATTALRASQAASLQNHQEAPPSLTDSQQTTGSDGHGIGQARTGQPSRPANKNPEAAQPSRARRTRLLMDVVRAAHSINSQDQKASVLASLAQAAAATDPDRAALLVTDAEQVAQFITDDGDKTSVLAKLAHVVAAIF